MTVEPLVMTTREGSEAVDAARSGEGRPRLAIDAPSVENVHYGSIAVVSPDGALRFSIGDPHRMVFTRSTLKPFQALPFVRDDGPARFGWTARQVALMCASHSGEPVHTEIVRGMLASADCDETRLQCGCHVPGWYAALGTSPPPDGRWSPLQHNCSGKHAGFLAACRLHGEAIDDYLDPASSGQRRIVQAVCDIAGLVPGTLVSGTDGCSAPNHAMPLSRLALIYARLAQRADAPTDGDALAALFDAMTGHPELVSGTARSDLALMSYAAGDWVTKIGADGVQAIGIRSAGIGIAIKVSDGSRDALFCVVIEVLRQLDLLPAEGMAVPDPTAGWTSWHRTKLYNARGAPTGRILPAFELRAG